MLECELLVLDDHMDMRNWELRWEESDELVEPGNVPAAGVIRLSGAAVWSDLRAGTILTFIETDNAGGKDTSTDTGFDPAGDDWWINICTQEEQGKGATGLVSTVTNDGAPGDFSVGSADWRRGSESMPPNSMPTTWFEK